MHVMKSIGFVGLGIALVSMLGGTPVFAADKPIDDGSKIVITSPKDGDKVSDNFELKYELTKGSQAAHAHVYWMISIRRVSGEHSRVCPKASTR